MADALPADASAAPAPDIESMSDEQFSEFKKTLTDEAPAPKEEPEPPPPDDDDDDEAPPNQQGTVPHGKFHRANERRKEAERLRDEALQLAQTATKRMAELVEATRPPPQQAQAQPDPAEADPMPDYQNDPLGWIGWRQRQDQREAEARQEQQRQWQQQEYEARAFQDTLSRATARFAKVVQERPEMGELYGAIRGHVANLYAQQGYPAHQIPDLVTRYEADVIRWARQEYVPIEEALEQAAAKFGVTVPARQAAPQRELPERGPDGKFKSAAELEQIERTKQASKSLGGGGAPVRTDAPSAQDIVNMSDEDFAAFKKKHGDNAMRIAMGGA